jgi:hypothetical protein
LGSFELTKKANRKRQLGKVDSLLNERLKNVEWGEYQLADLFEIQNTLSFNKNSLTLGKEYDYVTRTSQNQGILQETGFVNQVNLNPSGTWSLGLLQMDFFYREREWYAGQFVRIIMPRIGLTKSSILYFTAILNKQKKILLSGLVRDVDKTFLNAKIQLPTIKGEIDFEFIDSLIAELETQRIAELETHLTLTGLKDYTLTNEEKQAFEKFEKEEVKFGEFEIQTLFDVSPSKAYAMNDRDILIKNGKTPYVSNQSQSNGYIGWSNLDPLNPSNVITLSDTWQSERTIFYQETEFIGKSHLQVMKAYDTKFLKSELFFVISSFRKAILEMNYDYGTKFNRSKIKTTKIQLPTINNKIDFALMKIFISAIHKLVIKDVVLYADRKKQREQIV